MIQRKLALCSQSVIVIVSEVEVRIGAAIGIEVEIGLEMGESGSEFEL